MLPLCPGVELSSTSAGALASNGFRLPTALALADAGVSSTAGEEGSFDASASFRPASRNGSTPPAGSSRMSSDTSNGGGGQPLTTPRGRTYAPRPAFDALGDLTAPESTFSFWKRIVSEGLLLFRLAVKLWYYLGIGWKWVASFNLLLLYAMLLMPGFLQMIVFYFFSPRVIRSVPYGRQSRQRLDLYLPKTRDASRSDYPVIIFVTGGAWTIGYKAWGALLAKRLSKRNLLVCSIDYRNFPQGSATQMLEDVNTGIAWVLTCIQHYGGDPANVTLVGQSAGGHLSALAMIRQAEQAAMGVPLFGAYPAWDPKMLRAFVGVSGAYDLVGLMEHLHRRGLYKSLFERIMSIDGKPALLELSPLTAVHSLTEGSEHHIPEVLLVHGTEDKTVPFAGSVMLHEALKASKVVSRLQLFDHKTHTSFLLEDPMCGGRDLLMEAILGMVTGDRQPYRYTMLCPRFLCTLAGWVCPF